MKYVFQDWIANKGNIKGRIILVMYRVASLFSESNSLVKLLGIPYIIFYRLSVEWFLGVELPWKLKIGPGLRLYHGQALVVNDHAVLGEGCILRNCTTIGVASTDFSFSGKAPKIGNNVDIGANVVIIGDIQVGDHSVIGAGSVVVSNIPPYAVVVGNPARVLRLLSSSDVLASR